MIEMVEKSLKNGVLQRAAQALCSDGVNATKRLSVSQRSMFGEGT